MHSWRIVQPITSLQSQSSTHVSARLALRCAQTWSTIVQNGQNELEWEEESRTKRHSGVKNTDSNDDKHIFTIRSRTTAVF